MSKVITLIILGFVAYYWMQTQKLKNLAVRAAYRRCQQAGVQFLDHTVVQKRLSFKRDGQGRMGPVREYLFEFTSTGEHRYQGKVTLLRGQVADIELEPYSIN